MRLVLKIAVIFLYLFSRETCNGQEDYFVTLSTVKPRPLAMGGAFISIEGDLPTIGYNPATFNLYQETKNFRLTLFLNPVAAGVAFRDRYWRGGEKQFTTLDFLKSIECLIKAVTVSIKSFEGGFLFGEESLYNSNRLKRKDFFSSRDFWNNSSHSFVARLKLAEKVSIGLTATLYYYAKDGESQKSGLGTSYGILLKPEKGLNVGLSYSDFPKNMSGYRTPLERVIDETINLGLSYKLTQSTIVSLDLRNLTDEQKTIVREVHLGGEQILFSHLALRGGYFKERVEEGKEIISLGLGLVNNNALFSLENNFNHPQFLFNYSVLFEKRAPQTYKWHLFSFIIRL